MQEPLIVIQIIIYLHLLKIKLVKMMKKMINLNMEKEMYLQRELSEKVKR